MIEHDIIRCPSCDTANPVHATFCTRCGTPVGRTGPEAPVGVSPSFVGAADDSGVKAYMIGATAVAAVLVVGGALFFFADSDEPVVDGLSDAAVVTSLAVAPSTLATTPPPAPTSLPTTPPPATSVPAPAPPAPAPATAAPAPQTTVAAPPETTVAAQPAVALSFVQADEFFRGYIAAAMNGEYNAAWSMLSLSDQADYSSGFDQFVGFWRSVSFAEVQRVTSVGGSAGFQSLEVEMAYGQTDGDPTSYELIEVDVNVRPDGFLQIFDYRYIRNQ